MYLASYIYNILLFSVCVACPTLLQFLRILAGVPTAAAFAAARHSNSGLSAACLPPLCTIPLVQIIIMNFTGM